MTDRITIRRNMVSHGYVVEAGVASFYTGPIWYRVWRAKRFLSFVDKHGVKSA